MRPHCILILSFGILFHSASPLVSRIDKFSDNLLNVESKNFAVVHEGDQPEIDPNHINLEDPRPDYSLHTMPAILFLLALLISIITIPVLYERPRVVPPDPNNRFSSDLHFLPIVLITLSLLLVICSILYLIAADYDPNYAGAIDTESHHTFELVMSWIASGVNLLAIGALLYTIGKNHRHFWVNGLIGVAILTEFLALMSLLNFCIC